MSAQFTKIYITWSEPKERNGVLTDYKVCWSSLEKIRVCEAKISTIKNYIIPNLSPGVRYSVMVSASTKAGMGPPSTDSISTTKSGKGTYLRFFEQISVTKAILCHTYRA